MACTALRRSVTLRHFSGVATTVPPEKSTIFTNKNFTIMKSKNTFFGSLMLMICGAFAPLCACSSDNPINNEPVQEMDLNRYLGSWYELARFDHSFERGLYACTANYSMNDDGTIKVLNSGLKDGKTKVSEGKAKTTGTVGLLRVSFFGPFYSDYRVMMLADDYSYALVGSGSDKYLWILSRTPELSESIKQSILQEAVRRGYNINNLIWVDQSFYTE